MEPSLVLEALSYVGVLLFDVVVPGFIYSRIRRVSAPCR